MQFDAFMASPISVIARAARPHEALRSCSGLAAWQVETERPLAGTGSLTLIETVARQGQSNWELYAMRLFQLQCDLRLGPT